MSSSGVHPNVASPEDEAMHAVDTDLNTLNFVDEATFQKLGGCQTAFEHKFEVMNQSLTNLTNLLYALMCKYKFKIRSRGLQHLLRYLHTDGD